MQTCSLFQLVRLDDSREFWPEEFNAQIASLEDEPNGYRDRLLVLADWLADNDEPELAGACRYVAKRDDKVAFDKPADKKYGRWYIHHLPYQLTSFSPKVEGRTLAAALATTALQLAEARKELE